MKRPPLTVCDLNGDRYRAVEWAMASMRAFSDLHGDEPLWHPADCVGDPGAAAGALSVVWATAALVKGYAPLPQVLVWGASDGALRGAALLASMSDASTGG
jgi:3-oxoacyl-[acyl-carrier-protein] synthase-1